MTTWLREPLVHFLVIGALLFSVHAWTRPSADPVTVVIDANRIAQRHIRQTATQPDAATLQRLIERDIERELLYREARALGLDDGDEIVRRRLVQKMQIVLDEVVRPDDPDDDVLRAFLAEDPRRFAAAPRRALTHVFFRASTDATAQAERALTALQGGAEPEQFGAPFLRGLRLGPASEAELARIVDPQFAREVFADSSRTWRGPIVSTYGVHLVRIDTIEPGRAPNLGQIRASVLLAWREAESERRRKKAIQLLRDKYNVIVRGLP